MGEAVSIFINEAMKVGRASALNAEPWKHTENRTGLIDGVYLFLIHEEFCTWIIQKPDKFPGQQVLVRSVLDWTQ